MMHVIVFFIKFRKNKDSLIESYRHCCYIPSSCSVSLASRVACNPQRQIARDTEHRKSSVIWEILLRPIVKTYWIKLSWRQLLQGPCHIAATTQAELQLHETDSHQYRAISGWLERLLTHLTVIKSHDSKSWWDKPDRFRNIFSSKAADAALIPSSNQLGNERQN